MSAKNPYDVLGVAPNATLEEIRQAYLLRSKVVHPDRFDQASQPDEWGLANKLLSELNEAYGILRRATTQANSERAHTTRQPAPPREPPSRPPPPPVSSIPLKSGSAAFASLPTSTQKRLAARASGDNKVQLAIELAGPGWNYFWSAAFAGWFGLLLFLASHHRWSQPEISWFLVLSAVAALLQSFNSYWMVRWHLSPIKSWMFITPLYVVKTHLDRVWFWPLPAITHIEGRQNFVNGVYQNTSVRMDFGRHTEEFTVWPHSAFHSLLEALRVFDKKLQLATTQNDQAYLRDEDDFLEHNGGNRPHTVDDSRLHMASAFAVTFLVAIVAFAAVCGINREQPVQMAESATPGWATGIPVQLPNPGSTATQSVRPQVSPTPQSLPQFLEPEHPLPQNGEVFIFSHTDRLERHAPLEIRSSFSSNYLVKLADAYTDRAVLTVFVRGGNTVNVDVPLGTYVIKYAVGDKWYGHRHLFGPTTAYHKAERLFSFQQSGSQISGYTITLYKVQNGNLPTESIRPDEF